MNFRLPRPIPQHLAFIPEQHTAETPQRGQTHVCHKRRDEPVSSTPFCNKARKTVAPKILDHGDIDEDGACGGLVRVDGVSGCDGWQ